MINIVIFSKDRACQLDLLLRSIFEHVSGVPQIHVLYTYSSKRFKAGYDKLYKKYMFDVMFREERNFKNDTISLANSDLPYFLGLADDNVIIDPFSSNDLQLRILKNDQRVMSLNIALGKNITDISDKNFPLPAFETGNKWDWTKQDYYGWGYPMRINGHIYRTKQFVDYITKLDFFNPNSMEATMANNPILDTKYMCCYDHNKIIELCINRVQDTCKNKHGNISAEFLNNKFLNGYEIELPNDMPKNRTRFLDMDISYNLTEDSMKAYDTGTSLKHLEERIRESKRVCYSRFGDGDILVIGGKDDTLHKYNTGLSDELRDSIRIKDPNFMRAASVGHPIEEGMEPGVFAPFDNNQELQDIVFAATNEKIFYNHVLFHYLAVFKPQDLKNFLNEFIIPKKKMFIGCCKKENMELLFGKIDYYVQVPSRECYGTINEWWPEIEKDLDKVDVVLPACGLPTRALAKRIWETKAEVHCIDIGSIVDIFDGNFSRTWSHRKGKEVLKNFHPSLKLDKQPPHIDVHIPYEPGNLGKAYNDIMRKSDGWVLFLDHDAMILRPKWYEILQAVVGNLEGKIGWITGTTNRIYCEDQCIPPKKDTDNIEDHAKHSDKLFKEFGTILRNPETNSKKPLGNVFSGFFILTNKEAWEAVGGFEEKDTMVKHGNIQFRCNGFTGVDNDYFLKLRRAGYQCLVMPGLYSYHIHHKKADMYQEIAPIKDITLSVCMQVGTQNLPQEEEWLTNCLDSVKDVADEIIFLDTGCTAAMRKIAEKYKPKIKIFDDPWRKDMSYHRNKSVEKATGDWLLFIDIDETLNGDKENLKPWLASQPEMMHGAEVSMRDIVGGNVVMRFNPPKIFRNGKIKWKNIIHNRPQIESKQYVYCPIVSYDHFGYDLTAEQKEVKMERTIGLLKKRLKDDQNDFGAYFYLAQQYGWRQDWQTATKYGEQYLRFKNEESFNKSIFFSMARMYMQMKDIEGADRWIGEGLRALPNDLDMHLALCEFGSMTGNVELLARGARTFMNLYTAFDPTNQRSHFCHGYFPEAFAYCAYHLSMAQIKQGRHTLAELELALVNTPEEFQNKMKTDITTALKSAGFTWEASNE